jgi:hypothetical protein
MEIRRTILVLGMFALWPTAHAQDIFMEQFNSANQAAVNIAGTTAVNAAIGQSARNARGLGPAPARPVPSANFATVVAASAAGIGMSANNSASAPALAYRSSPLITAQTKRQFIDNLTQHSKNPGHAFDTRRRLESRDMIGEFSAQMSSYGLRTDNLGDVATGYWIANWSIANQRTMPSPDQVRAAQSQLSAALLRDARITRTDDATRQRLSEALIYQTMFALETRDNLVRASNMTGMHTLADIIDRAVLAQGGVDMRRLQLSSNGFALR